MSETIRIGTRGSQLALWQANEVSNRLSEIGYRPEIAVIKTTGDKRTDVPLSSVGGKGLFIKELEEALARREIDVAVHSLKDVPSLVPEPFVLAGFLERADARDAWVQLDGTRIEELAAGAVVGTSAPRRRAQLRLLFPSLTLEEMRGNVDTRINKLRAGLYDGAVLASAGLIRLGRSSEITAQFDVDQMVPAAGQGIVTIECNKDDDRARQAAAAINHHPSEAAARAERGVLQKFGEALDCYSAVAVHATWARVIPRREDGEESRAHDDGDAPSAGDPSPSSRLGMTRLKIRAFFGELEGERHLHVTREGDEADAVVQQVFDELVDRGAMELLK
ncbi:MAG TPA: hydroxymethylbilane synthase [Thermoanaerobaculia bacterium]|jgi:hydroxymethylbilane synthase